MPACCLSTCIYPQLGRLATRSLESSYSAGADNGKDFQVADNGIDAQLIVMSAKSILEADGKAIINYYLTRAPVIKPSPLPPPSKHNPPPRLASLYFPENSDVEGILDQAEATYPWLVQPDFKLVAKPDQLIKRRGKSGLLTLNKNWADTKAWIAERAGKVQKVEHTEGVLRQFLVEPFVPHSSNTEYYININSVRDVSKVNPSIFGVSGLDFGCRGMQ